MFLLPEENKAVKFRPMSKKDYKRLLLDKERSYEQYIEEETKDFNERTERAIELVMEYAGRLEAVTGDRDAIHLIREELRENEEFWISSKVIEQLVADKLDWISAIFRAEARRTQRTAAEKMEEIRQKRKAEREAALKAEQDELQGLTNFGLF